MARRIAAILVFALGLLTAACSPVGPIVAGVIALTGSSSGSSSGGAAPSFPAAPPGVQVFAFDGAIRVQWTTSPEATSYNLYWSTSPGVTPATGTLIPSVTTPHDHPGLSNGTCYYYVLTGVNAAGEGPASPEVQATPLPAPAFTVVRPGTSAVSLAWGAIPGAGGYRVYFGTNPGVDRFNGTLAYEDTNTSFDHTGLANGAEYFYVVTPLGCGNVDGQESAEVCAIPLLPPAGVAATSPESGRVELTWTTDPDATGYFVYRGPSSGVTQSTGTLLNPIPVSGPSYDDTTVTSGTRHYYVLTAVNDCDGGGISDGQSDDSTEGVGLALDPPVFTTVEPGGVDEIRLEWTAVSGASSYTLYWSNTPGVTPSSGTAIPGLSAAPYSHVPLSDQDHYYVVTAEESSLGSVSTPSSQASTRPDNIGNLDPSFGTAGVVTLPGGAGEALLIDSTGRILVCGGTVMFLARYTPDGDVDTTFGGGAGFVQASTSSVGRDLTIDDATGFIYVAGESGNAPAEDMAIWAYDGAGTVLGSFGAGGMVTHISAAGGNSTDRARAITLDEKGGSNRLLLVGESVNSLGDADQVIWAYDMNGLLDSSFASAGVLVEGDLFTPGSNSEDVGRDLILDGSSILVLATSDSTLTVVSRYDAAGGLDCCFGGGGRWRSTGFTVMSGRDLTLDASGRIVGAGQIGGSASTTRDMGVWRLDPAGNLDGFLNGGAGWVTGPSIRCSTCGEDVANAVTIDGRDRIVFAGATMGTGVVEDSLAFRLTDLGQPDTDFGKDGSFFNDGAVTLMDFTPPGRDFANDVDIDTTGRILVTGFPGYLLRLR